MKNIKDKKLLDKLIEFHGHLGPYLVIGYRMGIIGLRETGAKKYFGVSVEIKCPAKPPERCLVDGLQYATGATYGKANIELVEVTNEIEVRIINPETKKSIILSLHPDWIKKLNERLNKSELESFAQEIMCLNEENFFNIR